MKNLKEEIVEMATLIMLGKDVSESTSRLKDEYGKANVEEEIKASGFECILKSYI